MQRVRVCDAQHADMTVHPPYRGRFAPTPSGPLHLGSLLTALASWLHVRSAGGEWLLRVDDLDTERCKPQHTVQILQQLEQHGLYWDGSPRYQSRHVDEYAAALERLQSTDQVYACNCTRARLRLLTRTADEEPVYDGHCRGLQLPHARHALRLRVGAREVSFDDGIQGPQRCQLQTDVGDFVLRRRDGVHGYQLACAVDEHAQRITQVVRGADLLGSTFRQLHVLDTLGFARPAYRHLPVLTDRRGSKLSKQNHATPISAHAAGESLWQCLAWLGQAPPQALRRAPAQELIAWALPHWRPDRLPHATCIKVEQYP
jgi:glutamyl-Q tRNA(Asp) synthetase